MEQYTKNEQVHHIQLNGQLNSIKEIEDNIDEKILSNKDKALNQLSEITSKLPPQIKQLIEASFQYKRIPKEYLLSSILYGYCNAAGLAFKIDCMGYTNYSNLYFAIIGSRGDVKSPAMDLACSPLKKYDDQEYIIYCSKKSEQRESEPFEMNKEIIKRKQLLIQNATIEAAMFTHYQNPYSIGIFIDELSYLIDKMANKNSNEGSVWRGFLLQGNTNKHIDVIRKTTDSYRVKKSCPSLLGSIQHQFIPKMFANGNLESGLMDRFLFTNKLTNNSKISKTNLPQGVVSNYQNSLSNLLKYRLEIEKIRQELTINIEQEAQNLIHDYSQSILDKQQNTIGHTKEYMSKMMISIHKLVLLTHLMFKSTNDRYQEKISIETVQLAILINEFYFTNFKIILENINNVFDSRMFIKEAVKMGIKNGAKQVDVIAVTGSSKGYISKLWNKELENGNWKLETKTKN